MKFVKKVLDIKSILALFTFLILGILSLGKISAATVNYAYDANGNMTSDGTNCYTYNEGNQVYQVKNCGNNQIIAQYTYDYNGNRIAKKIYTNGTLQKTVYSPSDSYETVKPVSGSNQNTAYIYANNQLVAKKNPDGTKNYYQNDNLGSESLLTNQNGTIVEDTKYDPWGLVLSGGTQSKFGYTGQEKDAETALNYYNFRYYSSNNRHFTQPDDVIPDLYNPQTLNRYAYSQNNPIKYTDPSGHNVISYTYVNGVPGVGHTGMYFQDTSGNWYKADYGPAMNPASAAKDLVVSYVTGNIAGEASSMQQLSTVVTGTKAVYTIQKLSSNFDPNKVMKELGYRATFYYTNDENGDPNTAQNLSIWANAVGVQESAQAGVMNYTLLQTNCKNVTNANLQRGNLKAYSLGTPIPNDYFVAKSINPNNSGYKFSLGDQTTSTKIPQTSTQKYGKYDIRSQPLTL